MIKTNDTKRNGVIRLTAFLLSTIFAFSVFTGKTLAVSTAETEQSAVFSETELQLLDAIDTDFMLENVEYVHDNIGPRVAGTPADEASAEYFADVLNDLGYEPFSQATSLDGTDDYFETIDDNATVNNRIGASVTINGREYTALAPGWSDTSVYKGYNTPSVSGETVYFENADDATAADSEAVYGKIVLTNRKSLTDWDRNSTEYADVVRSLEQKGALAVVFFYSKYTVSADGATSSERAFPAPADGDDINIPVILASYLDGRAIVKSLTVDGEVTGTTATVVNRRNTHTSNILAVKEAEVSSDKYVIIGAHRDSVFGAEGADDNLSGTVNVLAIAKAFREISTEYNIIFALWAAEEDGLIGSKYFYSEFLYPENWGVEHVVAYYNMDMTATSQKRNSVLTVHTPYRDEDRNPLQSTAADVAEAQAERYWEYTDGAFADWWTQGPDDLVDLQYFGSCSDHASITGATGANGTEKLGFGEGIPSVYIFWGDNIGDGRNDVTEQNYHVVGDIYVWPEDEDVFTVVGDTDPYSGNYSIERAQILAGVFALSVYNTAAAPVDGIEDGQAYYGDTDFTVAYNYRENVTVDGKVVALDENGAYTIPADNAEHTVTVSDIFGNTASYTVNVYQTYTVTFIADGVTVGQQTVNYGESLTDIPEIPAKSGFDQIPPVWDVTDFSNITSDLTVNAVYTANTDDPSTPSEPGNNNTSGSATAPTITNGTATVNGKTVLYVNGKQVTGTKVVTVSGKTYAVVGGYVKTGKKQVVKIGSKYYIVNASGVVQKVTKNKLIKVGTKSYVVNKNGVVQRKASGNKLVKVGTKSYIVNKLGVVQKGTKNKLVKIGKKAYVVNKKGVVQKNKKKIKVGKKTYKTNKKGVATLEK